MVIMIKQITVKNLYNFRDETSIDFVNTGEEPTLQTRFQNDYISNFSLVYGKNNIGKTNFFKIIKEAIDYIIQGDFLLEANHPIKKEESSLFEIVLGTKQEEIRYGFEILISENTIIDEWMYHQNGKESCVFIRSDLKETMALSNHDRKLLSNLKSDANFVHTLQSFNHEYTVIDNFIDAIKKIQIIDCVDAHNEQDLIQNILTFAENKKSMRLLNTFLNVADLDIKEVKYNMLSKEEKLILKDLASIEASDISEKDKETQYVKLLHQHIDKIPSLINKDVFKSKEDFKDLIFKHKSGAEFKFNEISSGSKQLISIILPMIEGIKEDSVMLFDEIELGLHADLVHLVMHFFKDIAKLVPTIQFIISTHRAELLDYDFISNQNIILFKVDETKQPIIEYLSQYKQNPEHVLSQRYQLDAYGTNPDTSSEYRLLEHLDDILNGTSS